MFCPKAIKSKHVLRGKSIQLSNFLIESLTVRAPGWLNSNIFFPEKQTHILFTSIEKYNKRKRTRGTPTPTYGLQEDLTDRTAGKYPRLVLQLCDRLVRLLSTMYRKLNRHVVC
jgi:hypothetical protein